MLNWNRAIGLLLIMGNSLTLIFHKIDGVQNPKDGLCFILMGIGTILLSVKEGRE